MEENKMLIAWLDKFKGNEKVHKYMSDLTEAICVYKSELLDKAKKGKLSGQELYIYERYCVNGRILMLGDIKITHKGNIYFPNLSINALLSGTAATIMSKAITRYDVEDWLDILRVDAYVTTEHLNTLKLIEDLYKFRQRTLEAGLEGVGTARQLENFNRMCLGERVIVAGTGSEIALSGRIKKALENKSKSFERDVVAFHVAKYKLVYDNNDKEQLRQNDLLRAIDKHKADIVTRHELGELKTKEYKTYEKIINGEAVELPHTLVVNLGTMRYPLNVNLSHDLRVLGKKILKKGEAEDIDFANSIVKRGVLLEDDVMSKLDEVNACTGAYKR